MQRVFISYSHDSEDHKDRVHALADRLRADGVADLVLVAATQTYCQRYELDYRARRV